MQRAKIEKNIGYTFRDGALLERAFTHPSAGAHVRDNYQNMEFLGDSVLGFIVARKLFTLYSDSDEGALTKMRACVVSEAPLARAVDRLDIASELIVGEGERKHAVHTHAGVKCDLFESLTAAIYLDGGLEAAEKFVLTALSEDIASAKTTAKLVDSKSRINEYAMKKGVSAEYREEGRTGAVHEPVFTFSLYLGGEKAGEGCGGSKRAAQQAAAADALAKLERTKKQKK